MDCGGIGVPTRRHFLASTAGLAAGAGLAIASDAAAEGSVVNALIAELIDLCGEWRFAIDPHNRGLQQRWYSAPEAAPDSRTVVVPHTWQIEPALVDYYGTAWYERGFTAPAAWADALITLQFEAVFHTATVWVNGELAGEHIRKGYTAFTLDISHLVRYQDQRNSIVVRVDNAFDDRMLPRGHSSDWALDGGIYRPVQLLVSPKTCIERIDIEALPDLASGTGRLTFVAHLRNARTKPWVGEIQFRVVDPETDVALAGGSGAHRIQLKAQSRLDQRIDATLVSPKLWHFDHPHLYRLECRISGAAGIHCVTESFGVRRLEAKAGRLYLNGEQVRLVGVERMAGSHPDTGMAETASEWRPDHADLKNLNCVFTRAHWPQDRRVLDYCDNHGILIQCEVPAWGSGTFEGMGNEPDADLLQNGLEQLREMIARDRNHPSVIAWGLCNEIAGQRPADFHFAQRLLQEAKGLDPNRLITYASNTLFDTPQRDVAALMDIIESNEYFGSWQVGTAANLEQHLDQLHALFPDKPIVISEYGYCACTPEHPEGDEPRIQILESHNAAIRSRGFVGGSVFFCYNDYRTQVGDRGIGALQHRVSGVVDLYGTRKPSYDALRRESGPIESVTVRHQEQRFWLRIRSRRDFPMYTLRGYRLRGIRFGQGGIPEEQQSVLLPDLPPGDEVTAELNFAGGNAPERVTFEILRPTHFSTYSLEWKRSA